MAQTKSLLSLSEQSHLDAEARSTDCPSLNASSFEEDDDDEDDDDACNPESFRPLTLPPLRIENRYQRRLPRCRSFCNFARWARWRWGRAEEDLGSRASRIQGFRRYLCDSSCRRPWLGLVLRHGLFQVLSFLGKLRRRRMRKKGNGGEGEGEGTAGEISCRAKKLHGI